MPHSFPTRRCSDLDGILCSGDAYGVYAQPIAASTKGMGQVAHGIEIGARHGGYDNGAHAFCASAFDNRRAVCGELGGIQMAVRVYQHEPSQAAVMGGVSVSTKRPLSMDSCLCASAASAGSCVTMAKAVPNSWFT